MEMLTAIQKALETRGPMILLGVLFLIGGISLIIIGMKIRKQSRSSALVSMILGILVILGALYLLIWTIAFGVNA
ncbi:DUF308 domain-containing protein [Marinilactibacillus sp. Marseille-P9653]|uniref:DUF308 domain-containing protein n=1 Tax=Marinilactibacillus sp. Marseille-P9653 TaxID=2866583 RepID=UPI001CE4A040|nr:DUF308 domain-containing protein [Marinilactibacillus sp. Marseille-P9653]